MPHEKTIKAATVWALAKYHDNTSIDSKAFSSLRTRDINKHMVDHVAMNDASMNIDLFPVEYILKDVEDEDFMVRNGPDGRGDHARLIGTIYERIEDSLTEKPSRRNEIRQCGSLWWRSFVAFFFHSGDSEIQKTPALLEKNHTKNTCCEFGC